VTVRLYLDEDAMDNDLIRALRARGVDLLTAQEAGMIEREDDEQLAKATEHGYVIYSFNICDFCRLHAHWLKQQRPHTGIIVSQQQTYGIGQQMRHLLKLISTVRAEEMQNRLEFLSDWE